MISHKALVIPEVQWLLATLMGLTIGYVLAIRTTFLLGGILAVISAWGALHYPPFTVIMFWVAYALQTTVFAGRWSVQGLYYPVYALMAANVFIYILTLKRQVYMPSRLILLFYVAFYGVVLLGLAWQPSELTLNTGQLLFIYTMGVLTAMQIRTEEHEAAILWVMIVTGLLVAIWTIGEARASGFAYRGGVDVNPNYIASIINLGLVAQFGVLIRGEKKRHLLTHVFLWVTFAVGLYANLLLASRGVTVALLIAAGIILMRNLRTPRLAGGVSMLVILIALFLLKLPGSQNFEGRFYEGGADPYNGRLQLWQAGQEYITTSSVWGLLFGNGMGASEVMVRGVHSQLTSVHNAYIQVAIDYGVVGLILFTLLVCASLWQNVRIKGYLGDTSVGVVIFLMIVSLTASMTDSFIFWIALGVTLPTSVLSRRAF